MIDASQIPTTFSQVAPYPHELEDIVQKLQYRPGWKFSLTSFERDPGSEGLTFIVRSLGYDSYHPENGETYGVRHFFPVPPATYNRQSWLEWVRDRLLEIEAHETCEFMVVDGRRPFAPNHGPGWNPYVVRSLNTAEAAETTFRGEHREGTQAMTGFDSDDAHHILSEKDSGLTLCGQNAEKLNTLPADTTVWPDASVACWTCWEVRRKALLEQCA